MKCPFCQSNMTIVTNSTLLFSHKLDSMVACKCDNTFIHTTVLGYKTFQVKYYLIPFVSSGKFFWVTSSSAKQRTHLSTHNGLPLISIPQFISLDDDYCKKFDKYLNLKAFL